MIYSPSSNDVIPTATNVAAVTEIVQNLIPAVESLIQSLEDKAKKWEKVYKNGRTHLMDATPVSLGQEFSGYSALLSERLEDIKLSLINASKLAIGGTAVGTGINAPDNFGKDVAILTGDDGTTERIRINKTGLVGIGNTRPSFSTLRLRPLF